jgi:hypothetical protein
MKNTEIWDTKERKKEYNKKLVLLQQLCLVQLSAKVGSEVFFSFP